MNGKTFNTFHIISGKTFNNFPLDWDQIFHRKAPIAVEIGFGNGEFLVHWSKQQPDWNFIGIDYSIGSVRRLQKRLVNNYIENVRIINDDALFTLRELFPDNSIHQIIMNFPDPWPKKRHKDKRMLQSSFIETLGAVLEMNGTFELVTDQSWFAQDSHSLFLESPFFKAGNIEKNPHRSLLTKYEKKWRNFGCDIYRIASQKGKNNKVLRILGDSEMPHFVLKKDLTFEQISQLLNFEFDEGQTLFIIKKVYQEFNTNSYLLRVITKDYEYRQVFCIVISRNNGEWIIKPDDNLPVYQTPAVKLAVRKVGIILSK